MGHLGDTSNTFWQLLSLASATARWRLVTPPGVADNGGLVSAAADGAPFVAGIEASQDLAFSPLASTSSHGRRWSPGLVPGRLATVPDALAITRASDVFALLESHGGTVLRGRATDLERWSTIVTARALASSAAGRACGIVRITAVGATTSGDVALGAACTRPGVVGIFTEEGTRWRLVGGRVGGVLAHATTEVVRLTASSGSPVALVVATTRAGTALVGGWPRAVGPGWTTSSALDVGAGEHLVSTAVAASGGVVVTLERGAARIVELLGAPRRAWTRLPDAPAGTASVAYAGGGRYDAFVVDGSTLVDYVLDGGASSWRRAEEITAPIQYGSSG
ncbi:MAG TPA: hypothetical protein VND23_04770 [Acidimicrobiales bacterium]|nr:hypothetical protein [Acidimicrobiales bacterium]